MAAEAHTTISPITSSVSLAALPIAALSAMLDACDLAVSALLGVINIPSTAVEACGEIEDWMEQFSFRRQTLIAELEIRVPTNRIDEVLKLRALVSRAAENCETPFEVLSYVAKVGNQFAQ